MRDQARSAPLGCLIVVRDRVKSVSDGSTENHLKGNCMTEDSSEDYISISATCVIIVETACLRFLLTWALERSQVGTGRVPSPHEASPTLQPGYGIAILSALG